MASEPYVVSSVNYLDPDGPPPALYWRLPPPGTQDPQWEPHDVRIQDIRGHEHDYTMDEHGFEVIDIGVEVDIKADKKTVQSEYYPAVCDLVKNATGASEVYAFDYNFRSSAVTQYDEVADKPAYLVHNDYTESSAAQRVRVELGDEKAGRLLAKRFTFINLWRPINHTVEDLPLGVIAGKSTTADDYVTCAMYWPDRDGETWMVKHNPAHEWYYLSRMRTDEALLLKCFDSAKDGRARFAPHSAFQDPTSPADARPRESVEVRTVAFFD